MSIRPNHSWPLLDTAGAVIDAVGGTAKASALTGARLPTVSNWRKRDRLPPETFLLFADELALLEMRAPSTLWGIKPSPSAVSESLASDH